MFLSSFFSFSPPPSLYRDPFLQFSVPRISDSFEKLTHPQVSILNQQLLVQHFFVVVEELLIGAWYKTLGVVSSGDMNLVIWNMTKKLLNYLLKGCRYKIIIHVPLNVSNNQPYWNYQANYILAYSPCHPLPTYTPTYTHNVRTYISLSLSLSLSLSNCLPTYHLTNNVKSRFIVVVPTRVLVLYALTKSNRSTSEIFTYTQFCILLQIFFLFIFFSIVSYSPIRHLLLAFPSPLQVFCLLIHFCRPSLPLSFPSFSLAYSLLSSLPSSLLSIFLSCFLLLIQSLLVSPTHLLPRSLLSSLPFSILSFLLSFLAPFSLHARTTLNLSKSFSQW